MAGQPNADFFGLREGRVAETANDTSDVELKLEA